MDDNINYIETILVPKLKEKGYNISFEDGIISVEDGKRNRIVKHFKDTLRRDIRKTFSEDFPHRPFMINTCTEFDNSLILVIISKKITFDMFLIKIY